MIYQSGSFCSDHEMRLGLKLLEVKDLERLQEILRKAANYHLGQSLTPEESVETDELLESVRTKPPSPQGEGF